MQVKFEYANKEFLLEPYNTSKEKDLLLMGSFEIEDYDVALRILGLNEKQILDLSDQEKIALLYKFREISIGDEIPIKYKCKHCQTVNETQLKIGDNIIPGTPKDFIQDQFKELTDDNFNEFVTLDVDEMEFDEYDELFQEVKNSITKFNFLKDSYCIKCRKPNHIDISKNVIDHLSEDSLVGLYQNYADLVFFGKYTKQDIDTMYPFERTIMIGLLNKTREELNK